MLYSSEGSHLEMICVIPYLFFESGEKNLLLIINLDASNSFKSIIPMKVYNWSGIGH